MATGMVLTVAQTLFAALQSSPQLRDICAMFGYASRLDELQGTVSTIKALLLDAEAKQQELSHEAVDWVEKLKYAVYDADDLFDEFITRAQQLNEQKVVGGKASRKVRRFLSHSKQLLDAFTVSREIKRIRKKLDEIANDHTKFGFSTVNQRRRIREESGSYGNSSNIIGREDDKEKIVNLLLQDLDSRENVSFVTVVGIGGLGKTALAQLVYNSDVVEREFDLRLWVCVSEDFGVIEILSKMLKSITKQAHGDLGKDVLQTKVRESIKGKKYLLVLDDVWNESRNEWLELREFLIQGGRGSRIVVTTRSKKVAEAVGNNQMHELRGLSEEDSWNLFKIVAFNQEQEQGNINELVKIGKDIVKKCANVPLAIRVVGGLLYGKNKKRWELFRRNDFGKMEEGMDGIMPILKLSYHNLTSQLKSCFSYCALFPKDYVIRKEILISLWLAQGCIAPREGQSIEDVGEEYFSILLQRCFFQDIEEDEYGDILSCKIHDLMHDLAREVAGKEYLMLSSTIGPFPRKIRHLSINVEFPILRSPSDCFDEVERVRTLLQIVDDYQTKLVSPTSVATLLSKYRRLRVLDLQNASIKTLEGTTGKLLHLRYLDLSDNHNLERLPKWITKLHNLQTLRLRGCHGLKELPQDLSKLVGLRHLDIFGCNRLTHMPTGMDKLTCLHTLTMFVVGEVKSKQVGSGQLKDLESLVNLGGELTIKVGKVSAPNDGDEGARLLSRAHLKILKIQCEPEYRGGSGDDIHEVLLEDLHPNGTDLIGIDISGYRGVRLPGWVSEKTNLGESLPYLVRIRLSNCPRVQQLPLLSQLCHLKHLEIGGLDKLEYIEEGSRSVCPERSRATKLTFFPSFEELWLGDMPSLKGWWRQRDDSWKQALPSFPPLRKVGIIRCPKMTCFPPCSHVKQLELKEFSRNLSLDIGVAADSKAVSSFSSSWELTMDNAGFLNRLPNNSLFGLHRLTIEESREESWSEVGESFRRCASSLRELTMLKCGKLRSLSGAGLEHLTNLERLSIQSAVKLVYWENGLATQVSSSSQPPRSRTRRPQLMGATPTLNIIREHHQQSMMPSYSLSKRDDAGLLWMKHWNSLQSLELIFLPTLVNLPGVIQYLAALRTLHISCCDNLVALPEWLSRLTTLRSLTIEGCPRLKSLPQAMQDLTSLTTLEIAFNEDLIERCQYPSGRDWPKIQHIPNLLFKKGV